ncbi:peptidase S41 [Elizabethkingia meningoseptica]|uniref:S41 family peptidase n=1 Tax=Elizabethkingia meningoseptica TaxID=238 RepID=UPI00201212F1|nr:S41 family peptidase [Elizabethkingia meningoseptica]EJK5328858.1 peptidase S41 [Elizabethkingia meningoseptica]MCL1676182.1 S41 family peptidase [Elizabethkingia meningoseptica]MCL1684891.1 S41 family peptidase [Elizabethkingia meningoseptica]MDE5437754.1 peptidase S41 [Elizabethkingia meningoseptica]MDE5448532.1 peptidase S41 [Elizabethkingia meningoseptica]
MKRKFIKIPVLALGLIVSVTALNSCVKDDEVSITEPTRYTSSDVKSYADLFKVFWSAMDQRYNYFYEQKRQDGMDWNAIYREYYPKFAALKTYNKGAEFSDKDIQEDRKKAIQYFTDIIDPIIDRHFAFDVLLPVSKSSNNTAERFRGGMKSKRANIYNFDDKAGYMLNRLDNRVIQSYRFSDGTYFNLFMGNLKTNPDIYYVSYNQFALYNTQINLQDKYLTPNPVDNYVLTPAEIESNPDLNAIKDITARNKVRDFTVNVLNQWNAFPNSADVKSFNEQVTTFKNTEIVSDAFVALSRKLLTASQNLIAYGNKSLYASVLNSESDKYITWFMGRMKEHAEKGYNLPQFQTDVNGLIYRSPFYQKLLNPLHKGDIKKLIIDVRGNGGGAVIDFRVFVERFVTKNTVWGYQRTKEGNGQFNYTPWIPMQARPHQFGLPADIPIAILTDKGSYSMSEMSTMMLKSQGSQVVSVGDFSAGATAGLTSNPDSFNGGSQDVIAGVMQFYMPVMATKDANNKVIEGIGVEPNIYVTPPTDAEVAAMKNAPSTFIDRVMNEAVKYLSGK